MTVAAQELYDRSVDLVRRGDVRGALATLLDALAVDPGHPGALDSCARICRLLGAPDDARLFEDVAARPRDAAALGALGWRLVDQARPDVASSVLARGLVAAPGDPALQRELAFARLASHDHAGCLAALAPLEDDPDLSETERLDVRLLAAEAALYSGDRERCRDRLAAAEEADADPDQRARLDALHLMLGRSRHWRDLARLGLREWHFVQHAGIVLKTAGGYFEDARLGGRFGVLALRTDMVAFLLQRLLHLLERLGRRRRAVVPASEAAAPLAHGLAARAGLEVVEGLPERGAAPTLLVAANAAELTPFAAGLAIHRSELAVFSLNLDWERGAPVCPEVAGVLARRVLLPWEPRYALRPEDLGATALAGDERPPEEIGTSLAEAMDALPDDGGRARAGFEGFYAPLADELVLGNDERYPNRRQFTHISPCRADADGDGETGS